MKVAITGGTGLVGRACVDAFLEAGHKVVRLLRRPGIDGAANCTDIISGDLGSDPFEAGEIPSCDVFVHAAARVPGNFGKNKDARQRFFRDNLNGTRNALHLCAASGARRFVFLSSIKVNGERTSRGRPFRNDDVPAPEDAYAASKLAGEALVQNEATAIGIDYAIVRPPIVYGPGVRGNFLRLAQLARSGIPLPFANVTNRRAMVADRNLADLVLSIAQHQGAFSTTVLARDPEQLSTPTLIRHLADASTRGLRLWPAPERLLRISRMLPGIGPLCSRLLDDLEIDLESNPPALGWHPPYSAAEELARTMAALDLALE